MDDRMDAVKAELEAVSFVGETLAPFSCKIPAPARRALRFRRWRSSVHRKRLMRGLSPTGLKRVTL